MRRIERPLDDDSVRSADEQIYAAHERDQRSNALFDVDGNRKKLSASDPSQEAMRQEWRKYYFAAVDAKKAGATHDEDDPDRKSTRLNSSHRCISHAVF